MRFVPRTFAVLALAAALAPMAIGTGCGHGQVRETMVAPKGSDEAQRAYELGYRMGGRDRDSQEVASYARHDHAYDAASEKQFATGYADGYSRAQNRYGAPEASNWMTNADESKADD
jgi:hypothetical protein